MYPVIVACLMLIFPLAGVGIEHHAAPAVPIVMLVGKWFVFFGVGWRLALAGVRQIAQPRFTAEQIFRTNGDSGVLVLVRELGFANLGTGVIGTLSLWRPDFTLPTAIAAAIFYAAAGWLHVLEKDRGTNENIAMVSDLGIAVVLAVYAAARLLG